MAERTAYICICVYMYICFENSPLPTKGKERLKKEAGYSRLVGDRVNIKATYNMHRSLLLASRILKVHIETLTGFNHIYCSDSINTLLSHGFLLKNGSYRGNSG